MEKLSTEDHGKSLHKHNSINNTMAEKTKTKAELRWLLNYAAFVWIAITIYPGALLGYLYINPTVFATYPRWKTFNDWFMLYGLLMLTINWLLIRRTSTEVPKDYHPPLGADYDSKWCEECKVHQPPRAHHCNLCQKCVLKHDHHCFFAGSCIGHSNQRYFMVFTFWMSVGCGYSWFIGIMYILSPEWPELGFLSYVFLPVTIVKWLFGTTSTFHTFGIFLLHSSTIAMYVAAILFIAQVNLLLKGLSSYENKKKLNSPVAHLSKSTLICMTFGRWWFFNFLIPIGPFTKILGDGTQWTKLDSLTSRRKLI